MTTTSTQPTYYDHAINHTNAAEASAIARVRREAIEGGEAYRVDFTTTSGKACYWNGGRYDALGLAKSLKFNNYPSVRLTDPRGNEVDIKAARY